jgi:hypothetical protein
MLLLAVLCVPALTRVTQHLTAVSTSHESSGFSKSADSAPERVTIAPDLHRTASDVVAAATVEAVQPAWAARVVDAPLPASPPLASPRPLRAPPASVRL